MIQNKADKRAYDIVRTLFKDDYGNPFLMTKGQISIFRAIYERQYPRTQIDCYTQYGKSDTISMAILLRASTFAERWPVLGGTKDKADIIMKKIIKHLFENEYTLSKFEIGQDESIERIKRERSKERITFRTNERGDIGEIFVLSADARRKSQDAGDILIGHGAPNLVIDDAALIPDPIYGKALRMLGGHKDNFLLKITNSFGRNHAYRSRQNPKFHKIVIDWKQGIEEGRITQEYVDEMREELRDPVMFGILYDCVYPPADMIEEGDWMPLFTDDDVNKAMVRAEGIQPIGLKRLGVDVSEGVNYNAFVIRQDNIARVKDKTLERNLMETVDYITKIIREEFVYQDLVFVDAVAVGAGVVSRLNEMNIGVNGIKGGEKPTERSDIDKQLNPIEFYNMRAEMYWNMATWIKQGGALEPSKDWMQLTKIRYKEDASKRIKIMPKDEMRRRALLSMSESTDIPDALALTFAPQNVVSMETTDATPSVLPYYPELNL